jgi:hypothetical protein
MSLVLLMLSRADHELVKVLLRAVSYLGGWGVEGLV